LLQRSKSAEMCHFLPLPHRNIAGRFTSGSSHNSDKAALTLRATARHCTYTVLLLKGFATLRAWSMNSCTVGLGLRPFKVTIPIGAPVTGNSTGNFLMNGWRPGS
jgi:hypothetical protein